MNTTIKKLLSLCSLFFAALCSLNGQNVGINTTGATPSINAILDLNTGNSGNLGLIVPNASLSSLSTFNPPIANAATAGDVGMMVYNTNAAVGTGIGYYFWNGSTWVSLAGGGGGSITGANNGLSISGTTVQLGGPLIQNTTINLSTYSLTIAGGALNFNTAGSYATSIGTGGTGAVNIGNATGNVFFPYAPFTTANSIVYTTGVAGQITALAPSATANYVLTTTTAGGAPSWQASSAAGVFISETVYTSGSGTYTVPANTSSLKITIVGGGGGGGGAYQGLSYYTVAGGGGGAGGAMVVYLNSRLLASYAYSVGIGGGAGGSAGTTGGSGNATTFGSYTAGGGGGGTGDNNFWTGPGCAGGGGGTATGGTINIPGQPGGYGSNAGDANAYPAFGGAGGSSGFGFGFGAPPTTSSETPSVNAAFSGLSGTGYGSGGSGALAVLYPFAPVITSAAGGTGTGGIIVIDAYK